ncbi:MAG: YkgJ family cysteine cluster protein [Promethearchaeota archaeon]
MVDQRILKWFGNRVNDDAVQELEAYERKIIKMDYEEIIRDLVKIISTLKEGFNDAIDFFKDNMPKLVKNNLTFSCNNCGKCCSTFKISVSIGDLVNFLENGRFDILSCCVLDARENMLRLMNKSDFIRLKMIGSPKLVESLVRINPDLEKVNSPDLQSCIFHDSGNSRCTIYHHRPLDCKLYPAGLLSYDARGISCPSSCLSSGPPVNIIELEKLLLNKFVSDCLLVPGSETERILSIKKTYIKCWLLIEALCQVYRSDNSVK